MISVFDLVVLMLASGRIAYCVTEDEIFEPLRRKTENRWLDTGSRFWWFLKSIFECPYCLTFHTSFVAFALWILWPVATVWAAIPFAIWCVSNVIAVKGLMND